MAQSGRKRKSEIDKVPATGSVVYLPKNAVSKLRIGQSFAEYDSALDDPLVYVQTPAVASASDFKLGKYFYVGRRGTGKTAIRRFCDTTAEHSSVLVPEIFSPSSSLIEIDLFKNVSKKPFRSLVSAFRRALQDEILVSWRRAHRMYAGLPRVIARELEMYGDMDFDTRSLQFIAGLSRPLVRNDEQAWLREHKMARIIGDEMKVLGAKSGYYSLLIDSIDDFWDGSEQALAYLTAFMHACLEMSTQVSWARALMFLRENIFERVRERDSESSRIETSVVSLEWNEHQLVELIERRLNRQLVTKLALDGSTWSAFFEDGDAARREILENCQFRPRDVVIYVNYAVENAQARNSSQIMIEDVQSARRRFSDNRFKDLGDEYSENYPQIGLVLTKFYGLGRRFTFNGIECLLKRILDDAYIKSHCAAWIYRHNTVETFVRLLYNIGFVGLREASGSGKEKFRAVGSQETTPPAMSFSTEIVVHRSYWTALDLQDVLVREMPEDVELGKVGIISDLPGGMDQDSYIVEVDEVISKLAALPKGTVGASGFEEIVGDVLRLCFFRSLYNVESRSRDVNGSVIRDWVAANRAPDGFWEMVRSRYQATNVVWECKNYEDLSADDFHQVAYYLNTTFGLFGVLVFRGDGIKQSYFQHLRRIATDKRGFILPLTERDLQTFLRQAKNGKVKEDHIQDRYDAVLRKLS